MKNLLKKIFILLISIFVLFSFKNVFSAGFNYYINSIKESAEAETASGACKNICGVGYYQLKFGLPFQKMSRCACVPLGEGVGALMVSFVQFLLSSIGVVSVIILIIAGFMRAFSAGNMNTVKKANNMIKNAFIGVIAVIFSGSALAIINPDLVNDSLFGIKLTKIDAICVDDAKDKSDGTADGFYTDKSKNINYKKNCFDKYVCVNNDCVIPKNSDCLCSKNDLQFNMCINSSCGSGYYCDVEGADNKAPTISGKCYQQLPNGKTCVRGADYSCISLYCDDRGYCNSPSVNKNACQNGFGCWEYKNNNTKICVVKKCMSDSDCKNVDFKCYNEFCVPEYNKCFNGDIVKCGESKCNQNDPY